MKLLVIGCGYAGKRHALNIKELGHSVSVYDTDGTVMAWVVENGFEWMEKTSDCYKAGIDGAIISTPPEQHYRDIHSCYGNEIKFILCEKPLGLSWTETITPPLWSDGIMMAHNYLFSPKLHAFKKEMIANLRSNRKWEYVSKDYLPHWHGESFANEYEDRHEARDGCMAVSVSHQIYILDYLFGLPDREEYYKLNMDIINTRGDNAVTGIRENATSRVISVETWLSKEKREHFVVDPMTGKGFDWTKAGDDIQNSYKLLMKCFLEVIEGARDIPELCKLSEGIRIVKAVESATYIEDNYV